MIKNISKWLLAFLVAQWIAIPVIAATGPFSAYQTLTAAALNNALASPNITGGTIDGVLIGGTNPVSIYATLGNVGTLNASSVTAGSIYVTGTLAQVNIAASSVSASAVVASSVVVSGTITIPSSTTSSQAIQSGQINAIGWGAASGTANAITLTPSIPVTAYSAGQKFQFKAASSNTSATTLAVSGLSPIAVQINGNALVGGEIVSGKTYTVLLDSASTAQLQFYSESYIEGTWSPSAGAGMTGLTSSSGTYTKIGRQVFITGIIAGTSALSITGGGVMINNLPFAASVISTGVMVSNSASSSNILQLSSSSIYPVSSFGPGAGTFQFSATYIASY